LVKRGRVGELSQIIWYKARVACMYYGVFSVTRICSRTRNRPACVAPAKNNFILLCIYCKACGAMDAARGVTPVRGIHMRERAYNFSVHFRVGRGARTVLY
jgi:hypothetical protein